MRMVYLQSGRVEFWAGAASFRAGNGASESQVGSPEVTNLPLAVRQRIARAPKLALGPTMGGATIRSIAGNLNLKEIRDTYQRLRRELPEDDITPELFLMSALAEYAQASGDAGSR